MKLVNSVRCAAAGLLVALSLGLTAALATPLLQQKALGDVELTFSADQEVIDPGGELSYTVAVRAPRNVVVNFEAVDEELGPFRVLARAPFGPVDHDPKTYRWQRHYTLTAETAGTLTIPSVTVRFSERAEPIARANCITANDCFLVKRPDRTTHIDAADQMMLKTDPVAITVTPAAMGTSDPLATGMQEQISEASEPNHPLLSTALALALAAVLVGVWSIARSRGRRHHRRSEDKPHSTGHPPNIGGATPRAQALRDLDVLRFDHTETVADAERFYDRLIDILRAHLGTTLGIGADQCTSDELLAQHATRSAPEHQRLAALLTHCDRVRFAALETRASDRLWALEQATLCVTGDGNGVMDSAAAQAPLAPDAVPSE